MNFTFADPIYLLFLFVIPVLFFIHFYSISNKKKVALNFANFDAISRIQGVDFFSKNIFSLFLISTVILFLSFSASGFTIHTTKQASAFSFVIAVDSSQSMEARDFSPSRLDAAKEKSIEFVKSIPFGGNLAVVSFAGNTKIETPLTNDKGDIIKALEGIELSQFGGTDFFELAITSSNLLSGEDSKALIILSDGQINVGDVQEIIDYSVKNDLIVHTIGIGTKKGGKTDYAFSKLDEDTLKSIAYNTGGKYFSATNESDLTSSLSEILDLTQKKVSINISKYLVILSFIIILFDFFMRNTRYYNIL